MIKALLLVVVTVPLFARSAGAPAGHTGAPGNRVCTVCHVGSDVNPPGGSLRIEAGTYRPGQAQTVRVTVAHPESQRWGFQITARWARDLNQTVGRFAAVNGEVQAIEEGQYATHTSPGTQAGANGTKTFEFQWTPPAGAEEGDVVFYAAGNASNASGNPQGDRIYTTTLRVQPEITCGFTERPVITRVEDAASFNLAVNSNALVTIRGSNFQAASATREAIRGYVRDNQFPKELNCVAVEIEGQRVPILYVSGNQINVQAPRLSGTGELPVKVIMNANRPNAIESAVATLRSQALAPRFFTFNGRSVAARVAGEATIIADPAVVPTGRPARPGEVIELYATGLGPTEVPVEAGAVAPMQPNRTTGRVTVTVGGTTLPEADVMYAGLAPGNISGLYQINIRIPTTAANGDLPIMMTIGGEQSIAGATVPVRAQ